MISSPSETPTIEGATTGSLKLKMAAETALAAPSSELRVDLLPSDPLLHIFSFLDYRDLIQ